MVSLLFLGLRRVLPGFVAAAAALAATGLTATATATATAAAAAADDVTVTTINELQTATSTCAGADADPTTITLAADITSAGRKIAVACHAVLDLAGHDLSVRNVVVNASQTLTITDTEAGGTLTANASSHDALSGIQTTGATLTVESGLITAFGGLFAAGIGGGDGGTGGSTTVDGGSVTAAGGAYGSGIGGGFGGAGGTTTVNGGSVTAAGGAYGSGIGGGFDGAGGTTTVDRGSVTATGGEFGSGLGGGNGGVGGTVAINGGTVTATGGYSAIGPGDGAGSVLFGSLSVDGGLLRLPSGLLRVPDSTAGAEITVGPLGVVAGSTGPEATYATIVGAGQVDNHGRVLLPKSAVTDNGVTVWDRHYAVRFDTHGGSTAPAPVPVFADTFDHGDRVFPPDPVKVGRIFAGWNTAADGSGHPVTSTSILPGSSEDGAAVQVTAHAQWLTAVPAITKIVPSSSSVAGGIEVVITGSGFTSATVVSFGVRNPVREFTVDSATQITAVAPPVSGPGVRNVRVRTADGLSPIVAAGEFTYIIAPPTITGVAPSSGPMTGGTEVVITGTDFTGATTVRFGKAGPATTFTIESPTQITATSPASAIPTARDIRVTTAGGESAPVAADRFIWLPPIPAVTGVAPSSGPLAGGTVVVITGTDFTWATRVRFGKAGQALTFTVDSPTQITATSPASAVPTRRHISVTSAGGESTPVAADLFTWQWSAEVSLRRYDDPRDRD